MTQKQDWDDWVDGDAPGNEPLRLRDDAPEDIKEMFEEWKKRDVEKNNYDRTRIF